MGQPKLRPDAVKAGGRYPAGVLGDAKPIAQRFAHSADLREAALRSADPSTTSQPAEPLAATPQATASAAGGWVFRPRLLVARLILAALVLCLILGAVWLGSTNESQPTRATPLPETSAVLTVPDRVEAIAGKHVNFSIALDGTDGVPPRSVIAINGLPQGSNFSEGRSYGESEWNLKPDQIGDLSLILPASASGQFKLGIALIAPDNKVVAEAETLLEVAPAPADQVAAEESSVPSPEGNEAAAPTPNPVPDGNVAAVPAPVPDESEVAALAPVPVEGRGNGAESEEKPTTMEATGLSGDAPPGQVEQRTEAATAPSDDTPPNTVGQAEDGETGLGTVEPSVFVNLRDGPSSSAPVLGVVAKGTKLTVLDRKRGWVQVTDPATGKKGWIYSGLLAGEAKPHHRIRRAAPAAAEPKSESFWSRLGGWLSPSEGN